MGAPLSARMIQRRSFRAIAFVVLLAGVTYPLVSIYGIYPAFKHRLVADIEEEATRVALHLSESMLREVPLIFDGSMRAWGEMNATALQEQFRILELKIFNADALVTYSSDPIQMGERNNESYFKEIVARGKPFSRLIESEAGIPRFKRLPADVVETYLPIMKDGRFLGAFGIYYDITRRKAAMDRIAYYGSIIPLTLTCVFLALIFGILYRLERTSGLKDSMQEELRTEQERYNRLLKNLRSEYFVYSLGPGGEMTYVSPSVRDMLGLSPEEMMTSGYHAYFTENPVNDEARHRMAGSLAGIQQPPYEMEVHDQDGTLRFLEIQETPLLNEDDECVSVEGIAHDVTKTKKTEADLREHQYQLGERHEALTFLFGQVEKAKKEWERTMDCLEDMVFLMDREGLIRRCNRAVVAFTGRIYDEIVGTEWKMLMTRDIGEPEKLGFPPRGEIFHEKKRTWLRARSFPYLNPSSGEQDGFVVTLQNITEMKRTREELEETSERESRNRERIASALGELSSFSNWVSREVDAEQSGSKRKE